MDLIRKPFTEQDIAKALKQAGQHQKDPILDIWAMTMQSCSGCNSTKSKALFIETRLLRQVRALGLGSLDEYLQFSDRIVPKN